MPGETHRDGGDSLGVDLSLDLIRESLSCLGKHPLKLRHAYLNFSAEGKNIRGIDSVQSYPHLMYVSLSNNLIVSLKPLENLPALVQLKARWGRLPRSLKLRRSPSQYYTKIASSEIISYEIVCCFRRKSAPPRSLGLTVRKPWDLCWLWPILLEIKYQRSEILMTTSSWNVWYWAPTE